MTDELQKELGQRLGELSGKPETSHLHVHPLSNFGAKDLNINIISTDKSLNPAEDITKTYHTRKGGNLLGWHTDISYEPVPADYTILRMADIPSSGGGTVLSL